MAEAEEREITDNRNVVKSIDYRRRVRAAWWLLCMPEGLSCHDYG
jgi:hypothetical protein